MYRFVPYLLYIYSCIENDAYINMKHKTLMYITEKKNYEET